MRAGENIEESAEDLYENAPCGYLSTRLDGTIIKVNRTFEGWTGLSREELLGRVRFQELLSPGGQIYYETHYAPLLHMQGAIHGIAVDVVRADRSRLAAFVNSVISRDERGQPRGIRTMVFDATDRRLYERELVDAREREREIAQELQRRLLSGPWPSAPGIELGVAYRSGVSALEVGGDWYDAFWLEPSRVLQLAVGDVVGRGIEAAATMGQLRSAARAFAATSPGPGATLAALDEFSRRHDVGAVTTLVCAELDLAAARMRYACAGHPPPLIACPDKEPAVLWQGRSLPLGTGEPRKRIGAGVTLEPGTLVLLYTDGLVEDRHRPIDAGIARLAEELARRRHDPAQELARGLLTTVADENQSDDVCVLVGRLAP